MATFLKRIAHSVDRMISLKFNATICNFSYFQFFVGSDCASSWPLLTFLLLWVDLTFS